MSHQAPALICKTCIQDLQKASKFRSKCIKSANHFKKHFLTFEPFIWNDELSSLGYNSYKSIKDEPCDYNVNLFEDIAAIIGENCATNSLKLSSFSKTDNSVNGQYNITEDPEQKRRVKKIKHENETLVSKSSETQCHLCLKTFTTIHSMKEHMRAVHQKLRESGMCK